MKTFFRKYLFIFLLFLAAVLLGLNYFYRPFQIPVEEFQNQEKEFEPAQAVDPEKDPEYILSQLSSEQRIMQMVAQPITLEFEVSEAETEAEEPEQTTQSAVLSESPGLFTLFGRGISYSQAAETITNLKDRHQIFSLSPLIMVDHEGGKVQRLNGEGFSRLPSWKTVCALDVDERQAVLRQSANELSSVGIDIVLAPVLDVGDNRFLADRVCSIDSYPIVADRAMDFITVFEEFGIMSVIKHFPGIGQTTKDLHTAYDAIEVLEFDVKLYRYIIDQVPLIGVMIGHAGVISQDSQLPCSMSEYCVGELSSVYPEVLIITDALEMNAASYDKRNPREPKTLAEVSRDAIRAGNNVLLYGEGVSEAELASVVSQLTREYDANEDFKALVDNSVKKIIEYKHALN